MKIEVVWEVNLAALEVFKAYVQAPPSGCVLSSIGEVGAGPAAQKTTFFDANSVSLEGLKVKGISFFTHDALERARKVWANVLANTTNAGPGLDIIREWDAKVVAFLAPVEEVPAKAEPRRSPMELTGAKK